MTVQSSEVLIYDGKSMALHSAPLEPYLERLEARPPFGVMATNNWRGYIGEWEIVEGKLYLNRLLQMGLRKTDTGVLPCFEPNRISVNDIFPTSSGPVFVKWYTGKLRCPQGEVVDYHRGEFGILYERYREISVKRGMIVSEETVESIKRVSATENPGTEETASEQKDRTSKFRKWLQGLL